jgi:peptide/nickel transport system substrate-binding protein
VVGKKNPNYWDKGKPYLDGFRAIFIRDSAAQVAAIRGERAHIQFRGFPPKARDDLKAALGDKIRVQESPWDCILLVGINHERKPFDDARVRRALTLALDRHTASKALSQIAIVKEVAGVQVPGTPWATPPEELNKLAGYWTDAEKSRAEARRLLKEAGVPEGFKFTFSNRGIPMPYEPLGVWMIDQWRQVGLNVEQRVIEPAAYFGTIRKGDAEVFMDFQCGYIVEPDLDMYKFLSSDRNPANYGRYQDRELDALYDKQSVAIDPNERKKLIRAFEKRLLDEQAHYLMTLQWHRIIPHSAKLHGWTITPSHYLNNTLDNVWLSQ